MSTGSLADHLRSLSDEQLARLLAARPDLAIPVPGDLSVLAQRAQSRMSIGRLLDHLDLFHLEVLDAVRLAADGSRHADRAEVRALLTAAPEFSVERVLDRLSGLGLIWPDGDDRVRLAGEIDNVASPYPGGLGRPVATLVSDVPSEQLTPVLAALHLPLVPQPQATVSLAETFGDETGVRALLDGCPPEARAVLDRLATGRAPLGSVKGARRAGDGPDSPVRWLLAHGLIVPLDDDTVELPREIGIAVRATAGISLAGILHPTEPTPPTATGRPVATDVDAAGAGQVLEALRHVEALLEALAAEPTAVLKSGGLGVRELRRLARTVGVDEPATALFAEVAHASGLLDRSNDADAVWLPTSAYDSWQAGLAERRWARLATGWLRMTRLPALVGTRDDRDRVVAALSFEVERQIAPELRYQVLRILADHRAGPAPEAAMEPEAVLAVLHWRAPRRSGPARDALVNQVLTEAALVGLVARTGLTAYGAALLDDEDPAPVLAGLLPEPVDHVLVQADLTVIAPGPLEPALAADLALMADLESAGGATVYRVTPASVRRALDAGRSGTDLNTFFTTHSKTPVPQALKYLVDDVARRHGGLRSGTATSYLRSDDTALLAGVLADRRCEGLRLRRLAETVLISSAPVARVVETLRAAGYVPAAEDASGGLVLDRPAVRRSPTRNRPPRPGPNRSAPESDYLAETVAALRRGDAAHRADRRAPVATRPASTDAQTTLAVLQRAARERARVWLGYIDAHGGVTARVVRPVSIGGGYLRAEDDRTETVHTIALHRVTSAIKAEDR